MRKEQLLNIYEDNGLYGAKDQNGQIVITAQYTEMYQFSCGLSLVRNSQYQYAYIDYDNNIVIPFGVYSWCEPRFVCGYARVLKDKWGIINTRGDLIIPLKYDKIWLYRYCPWMRDMATSQISCNNGIDKKASHVPL